MPHLDYTVSHATAGDATGLSSTASSTGWRTPPCRKASCMLTLPAPSSIASIRIVNAGSALIEVLAGKASWTPAQYQVLVPVSCLIPVSQLAPAVDDAAATATTTDGSSHGHDDADEAARTFTFRCRDVGDQWERVQVVCRHYDARRRVGLARLILSDSPLLDTKRDDAGARAKAPATSTATSPRAATATATSSSSSAATTSPTTPRARAVSTEPRATTSSSPSPPSSPEAAAAAAAASSSRLSPAMLPKTPTVLTAASTTTTTTASSSSTTALSPKASKPERRQSDAANVANIDVVPFREILRGVTIVISGIQHPERGQVRDKATAMGARYLPDWNKHATHLICEFSNTPKYQQAKDGGGVIVTRQWINECFKAKARLPEASFLCKSGDEDDDDGADDGEPAAAAAAGTRRARPQRKAKQEAQQKMEPWIVRIDSEDASLLVGDLSDEAEDVDGDDDDDDEEGDGSARGGAKKRRAAKRKPTSPRTRRAAKRPKPNDDDEYNDDSQAQGGDDDDDDDEEFDIDDEEPQDDDDDEADDDDDDDDVASGSRGRRRAGARASARKPVTRATRQRKQPAKAVAAAAVAPKTAVSHATKAAEPPLNNAADDEDATEDMELESKPQQPQHQHAVLSKAASTHDDPLFERHDAPPPAVVHAGPVEPLPDFLAAVHCHVLTKEPAFKNHLRRIAAAYGARIDNYVFPDTTHVVTDRKWDASYYSLQDEQPGIVFVLPEWLEQCHRTQTAVDADDYLVPEE